MRLTRREQIVRFLLIASVVVLGLVAGVFASPVFAGECPIIGICG